MSILVIAEHDNYNLKGATLNTVAAAKEIGSDITLLIAGTNADSVISEAQQLNGVTKVLSCNDDLYKNPLAEDISNLVLSVANSFSYILAPATTFGKNILPRISAKLDVQQISDIISVESEDTFKRPIYAGSCIATVKSNDSIKLITVRSTAFDPVTSNNSDVPVESIDVVPNFFSQSQALYQRPINVRADLHFDINNIIQWCQFCIVNLHTDTVVPTEALDYCGNLKQIIFRYSDKHEDLDLNSFFTNLKRRKINLIIKYEGTKDISDVRFKYFDYPVAPTVKVETEHKQCKFLSKKSFITDSQQFTAEFTAKKLDNSDNFVYDDISSEELESFYLYE